MRKRIAMVLAAALLGGCAVNRRAESQAMAPAAPVKMVVIKPTCTAWHVCEPTDAAGCAAPNCWRAIGRRADPTD